MIAELKPYPECVCSSHAWLGQVPGHWAVLPNRAVFAEAKTRNHPDDQMLSVTIAHGIIRQQTLLAGSSKKDSSRQDKSDYKLVEPGDLAYNKMRAWQGALGASDFRGIVSPAYVVMRLRESDNLPRYYHYLYRTPHFAKEAERWSYGITSDMWSLRPEHFRMIYTIQPPPDEQAAIVRFLDWANCRLDRAIRAKRTAIALLNEQKQVIIHRAVTRGIDPSISLKPSGILWLGDIPAHWNTRKIKFLVKTTGGLTPNKAVARFWDGSIPWVSPKDMKRPEITDSIDHITNAALQETNISLIDPPAVLIVVRGMILARTFPTAVTRVPVTVNQDMKALKPRPELHAEFLSQLLTGIRHEILNLIEEAGHGTRCLRTDSWANFAIPLPPPPEQLLIVEHLNSELAAVDSGMSRFEREIDLLREYRTSLIADVATGKLDVREAAAKLPDEPVVHIPANDEEPLEIESPEEEEAVL